MSTTNTGARAEGYADLRSPSEGHRSPEILHPEQDESRRGFKTTEFFLTLVAVAGVLIATYADGDSLDRVDGWRFATWMIVAYVISRGLAKLASPNRTIGRDRVDQL